jgi:hypothetical protein
LQGLLRWRVCNWKPGLILLNVNVHLLVGLLGGHTPTEISQTSRIV